MMDRRTEAQGAGDGWSEDAVARLVRLKRHECPEGGHAAYVERFVAEFRERQRAELLRTSARGLLWERMATYLGMASERRQGHLAWGGVGLAVAACVAFMLVVGGGGPGGTGSQGGEAAALAVGEEDQAGVPVVAAVAVVPGAAAWVAEEGVSADWGREVPVSLGDARADGAGGLSGVLGSPPRGLHYSMGWESGLAEGSASVVPCEWGMPMGMGRGLPGGMATGRDDFSQGIWDEEGWKELARDLLEGMGSAQGGGQPSGDGE